MIRRVLYTTPAILPSFIRQHFDDVDKEGESAKAIQAEIDSVKGWPRVKQVFEFDDVNGMSHELSQIIQSTGFATLTGVIWGGIIGSRNAYVQFMDSNQATAFYTAYDARRSLSDKMFIAFMKGAGKLGWRLGLFCGLFVTSVTVCSTYRGDFSTLDYTAGGLMTGALYKANGGVKSMVAGGIFGGVLGTIAGLASMGVLWISGATIEDVRYYHGKASDSRRKAIQMAMEKPKEPLEIEHEQRVGKNKITLEEIEEEIKAMEMKKAKEEAKEAKKEATK